MNLFKSLLLLTIIAFIEASHSHESHDDAFDSILTTMKQNTSLQLDDVTSMLLKLGVHNCSNNIKHKCVTAESLFTIFTISTTSSVNEQNFSKFAPIIVYALLPNEKHVEDDHDDHDDHDDDHDDDHEDLDEDDHDDDHDHDHDDDHDNENGHSDNDGESHNDSDREIKQNVDVYKELLERYETNELCGQIFDQLLQNVNDTTGNLLHGNKCFSSHDILDQLNISSGNKVESSQLAELSVIIISRLLQRQCINVISKSPLPCSSYFLNHLFEEYATNDIISEKKIEELLENLKIGKHDESHSEGTDEDDHDHRRRRSISPLPSITTSIKHQERYRRETTDHDHEHNNATNIYQKCYSADELFAIYQVDKKTGFKLEKFERLCPALLHQIESNVCAEETHDHHSSDDDVSSKQKWGYGILAVAVISLCSVAGVAIIPFMKKLFYQKAVVFLISLAVGTLVGDALLHLFPHALGFHSGHDHNHDSTSSDHAENEDRDYLWKFLLASAAIYGFFLFETITHLFLRKPIGHSHSMEHTRRHSQFSGHDRHDHNVTEEVVPEQNQNNANNSVILVNMAYMNEEEINKSDEAAPKEKSAQYGPDHNNHPEPIVAEKGKAKKAISSVAWNIIIGDTIHNIADGIAIGVAFSDSITGGVSTAIAVFCHELPHELGDFAVLLTAGLSVKKALLANFLSACSCFIGLVFGILISEVEDVNLWIFAITAGFFIYIALTNMLPELMHSAEFNEIPKLSMFCFQNLGILTGFAIMFLLSYYEEDINI